MKCEDVFRAIRAERKRQDQLHPEFREFSAAEVAAVLAEECGEAVKELNALQWNEPGHTNEMLVEELIHTAAVAVRILEGLRFARMPEPEMKLEQIQQEPEPKKPEEMEEAAQDWQPERAITQKPAGMAEQKDNGDKMPYKGFVHMRCDICGKTNTFCSKIPLGHYKCRNCGAVTMLGEATTAVLDCKCGKKSKYLTNIQDYRIEVNCICCGQPNDLLYNAKRGRYEPPDYGWRRTGKKK